MSEALFDVAWEQYTDYRDKLKNKNYRQAEVAENKTVKGAILISLYFAEAFQNHSTNMTTLLNEMETVGVYNADITPPSLVISGLEAEAAAGEDVAVTAGANTITFPISLTSADYALLLTCITSTGHFNSYKIGAKTTAGFTLTVAETGTIDYRAVLV